MEPLQVYDTNCLAHGGAVTSWLVHSRSCGVGSSPGQDIVLCSWANDFTLIVPLSTQVYKWVLVNLQMLGDNWHPIQGEVEILLVA